MLKIAITPAPRKDLFHISNVMLDFRSLLSRATRPNLAPSNASAICYVQALKLTCLTLGGLGMVGLGGCSVARSGNPTNLPEAVSPQTKGQLEVRANGEDFVRDGFTSKDGWNITFDHLYVGLAEVTALQTDPPFDPDGDTVPQVTAALEQSEAVVVDLVNDASPTTALVATFDKAQSGRYNALGWRVVPAPGGPSAGQSLQLVGQASKDSETLEFSLDWDQSYQYLCGDFIGDQRKGILKQGDRTDLEATFHFDHLFGDGEAPPEDAINQDALGFAPLAALADQGNVTLNRSELQAQLSPEDFTQLETAIAGLAHVGEGHCQQVTAIAPTPEVQP